MTTGDQIQIPCVMMRGGTSRGPFFLASDLPADPQPARRRAAAGDGRRPRAGDRRHRRRQSADQQGRHRQSRRRVPGADVDYLFAQVNVQRAHRRYLAQLRQHAGRRGALRDRSRLGPGAATASRSVRIYNVNTSKLIEARILTPDGHVTYDGDAAIDGVPGTAPPIQLAFLNAAGSKTGQLLPTGRATDWIDGVEVSCVDAAMPVMLVRAGDLGKSGFEAANSILHGPRLHDPAGKPADRSRPAHGLCQCGRSGHPEAGADRPRRQRRHAFRPLLHAP